MKRTSGYLYALVFSLLIGGFAYFMCGNIVVGVAFSLIYFVCLIAFIKPWLEQFGKRKRKRRECYRFVSSFLISYALTGSLDKSYEGGVADCVGELKEVVDGIATERVEARIRQLESYFESEGYSMFLSLYSLYEEQGGDLLSISKSLLDELTRVEESGNSIDKQGGRNLIAFTSMWVLSFLIMGFLRFGLVSFFMNSLQGSSSFLLAVIAYLSFFLVSLLLYFRSFCQKPKTRFLKKEKKAKP
ncbi:MAG: hypothetical protein Q4F15_06015 [Bacillota bacterium]|nr:hypothetical protein [Bacillota bacterium]